MAVAGPLSVTLLPLIPVIVVFDAAFEIGVFGMKLPNAYMPWLSPAALATTMT